MLKIFCLLFSCSVASAAVAQNPNAVLPPKLKTTYPLKTPLGVAGQSNIVNCVKIAVAVDTSIRVKPQFAYLAIDFSDIVGTSQIEILNGKNLFWIFDKTGKEVKIAGEVLKSVKAAMGIDIVEMKVRIPYRLKIDKNIYTVHYRWESPDKSKNIDIVTSK